MSKSVKCAVPAMECTYGPVVVDGMECAYIDGSGWRLTGKKGYLEPPVGIIPKLNKEHWTEVGQFEIFSKIPLVRMAGYTFGWRDGNWVEAEPGAQVKTASKAASQKLYIAHGEQIRPHFFSPRTIIDHLGSTYGKGRYDNEWYDWFSFGEVNNGKAKNGLDRKFQKVQAISADVEGAKRTAKKRKAALQAEFIFIEL